MYKGLSSAVCENIRNENIRECDTMIGSPETIPTNFLKNRQYGGQGSTSNKIWEVTLVLMESSSIRTVVGITIIWSG